MHVFICILSFYRCLDMQQNRFLTDLKRFLNAV